MVWESTEPAEQYAQVSDARYSGFAHDVAVRSERERPFPLRGEFSDHELVSLVDYVRSGPAEPNELAGDGTVAGPSLDHPEPIIFVRRDHDGSVVVHTSSNHIGGQIATIVRTEDGWRLRDVAFWVK
jgi:hypothetical protein